MYIVDNFPIIQSRNSDQSSNVYANLGLNFNSLAETSTCFTNYLTLQARHLLFA